MFREAASSMIEFILSLRISLLFLGSLGFLDRATDGSNRSSSENSILKINVLQVIDPLVLELWRTENVAKATTVEGRDCSLFEPQTR